MYLGYEFYIWGSRPVFVSQWCAHRRVVVFHTLHRGQRYTIICPYFIICNTFYPRTLPKIWVIFVLVSLFYSSKPSSSVSAADATVSLAPARSIPACSHHHIPNHDPRLLASTLHRSRVSCITIYCTNIFCLFRI